MKTNFAFSLLGMMLLTAAVSPAVLGQSRYEANWESLDKRPIPEWFTDAKFGIFIHWGVYSVPAFAPTDVSTYAKYAEWYWSRLMDPKAEGHQAFVDYHTRTFGPNAKYQDFAADFKAEMWNPDEWARLFEQAGAKYVVLTSKHHEGFTLWPSQYAWNWNAVDIGPHRDLAGDLIKSVRNRGLRMGYYYSLYEWFNPLYRSDVRAYVDQHMIPQMKELVNNYKPDIVWTDGEWDHPSDTWKAQEFLAWLYNESPVKDQVVVNDRWGKETRSKHGGYYTTEYKMVHSGAITEEAARHPWEECRGIGGSFGYNRAENLSHYSSSEQLVHLLVDLVSDGGNLLLNIGPKADGTIPVIMQQRLTDMGAWLKVNGDAIYGTRRWDAAPEKKEADLLRFTAKGNDLYAISLGWPKEELVVPVKAAKGTVVTLLGYDRPLKYTVRGNQMHIQVPALSIDQTPTPYAHAFKISGVL